MRALPLPVLVCWPNPGAWQQSVKPLNLGAAIRFFQKLSWMMKGCERIAHPCVGKQSNRFRTAESILEAYEFIQ